MWLLRFNQKDEAFISRLLSLSWVLREGKMDFALNFVVELVNYTSFQSIDIDDCVGNACKNGGSCVDGINRYTCNCQDGFTGEECETGELINNVVGDFVGKATKV